MPLRRDVVALANLMMRSASRQLCLPMLMYVSCSPYPFIALYRSHHDGIKYLVYLRIIFMFTLLYTTRVSFLNDSNDHLNLLAQIIQKMNSIQSSIQLIETRIYESEHRMHSFINQSQKELMDQMTSYINEKIDGLKTYLHN